MRTPLIAAVVCVVAGLVLASGTAGARTMAAAPGVPSALTGNKVYRSGDPAPLACAIPGIRTGSTTSLKRFHRVMARCADQFWAGRFEAAGMRYTAPTLAVTTGRGSVCGRITANGAQYCPAHHTIAIRVTRHDVAAPFKMNLAHSVAHEWGHHVQQLAGILDAYNAEYRHAGAERRTMLSHRLEMQAECFAGVFYRATFDSIDPGLTWQEWAAAVGRSSESRLHGKPENLAYWQNRGYQGGTAAVCDTWSAPESQVG